MWRRAMLAVALIACRHARALPITIGPARELLVPVVIDDQPVELQLDTGASNTTLSKPASARLHLEPHDTELRAVGAAGAVREMSRARLAKLELGDYGAIGLSASVIDLGSDAASDGLLGMDVLGRLIVDVDFAHATFTPRTSGYGWRPTGLVELPCRVLEGGQVAIDATLDGRRVTAIIDLGANASFANELAAPQRSDATVRVITAAVGADGHAWRFRGFGDIALRAGTVTLVAQTLLVADLPIFAELGLAHQPAVIVGTDLLARRRIAIDALHRRVYVSR